LERGIDANDVEIAVTEAGKPYVKSPPTVTLAYNISHDSSYVAMVFETGDLQPGADAVVGVDIMKVELPRGETVRSFASVLSDQLTGQERLHLANNLQNSSTAMEILFKYWTLKESYTKALGMGLGFDFSRVEYQMLREGMETERVLVDGVALRGWEFRGFTWHDGSSYYVGMAARRVSVDDTEVSWTALASLDDGGSWIRQMSVHDVISHSSPLS